MRFDTPFTSAEEYRHDYDLVVACDGINSLARDEYRDVFRPDVDMRQCKFVWLGTHQKFDDAFTFIFEQTEHGWMWIHAYQFDADTATVIVECSQQTWDAWGFEHMSKEDDDRHLRAGVRASSRRALVDVERQPPARLGRVDELPARDLRAVVPRERGVDGRRRGDRALLDRLGLTTGIRQRHRPGRPACTASRRWRRRFQRYQAERRVEVLRLQSAARNSLEWFEQVERYLDLDPVQFNYSLLTRSQRISHENLRMRDPQWMRTAEDWFQAQAGGKPGRAPMFAPFRLRGHGVDQPRRRLADGAVQGGRRVPHRLALRALRRARQGRRGAGVHRDDLRVTRGTDHAGLHRAVRARARGRMATADDVRPRRDRREDLLPGGPLGPQGLDPARVAADRHAAARGQLAGHVGVADPVVAGQRRSEGDGPRRHARGDRPVRGVDADGANEPGST